KRLGSTMGWFDKIQSPKLKNSRKAPQNVPDGLWKKCSSCKEVLNLERLEKNWQVCPYCEHHFRLSWEERAELLLDGGKLEIFKESYESLDPLGFKDKKDYKKR